MDSISWRRSDVSLVLIPEEKIITLGGSDKETGFRYCRVRLFWLDNLVFVFLLDNRDAGSVYPMPDHEKQHDADQQQGCEM